MVENVTIRFRRDLTQTELDIGKRLAPPICQKCKKQTERIGTSFRKTQHDIALFACPRCDPEIFAELERMGEKDW